MMAQKLFPGKKAHFSDFFVKVVVFKSYFTGFFVISMLCFKVVLKCQEKFLDLRFFPFKPRCTF